MNIDCLNKYKKIHMIGIGGVSMSGIAEILNHFNFEITGSDITDSETIRHLISKGIKITIGHDLENAANSDLVVYTAAVKQDDPEIIEAKSHNIPLMERADFLGEITKCFKETICISGTHGKTTTTSMVALCFLEALKDPTIQVGANLSAINGNDKLGNSEYFILEACEYVESFLKFRPHAEIVLNIDNDHLDYFKNLENIKNSFIKYVKFLPEDGLLVTNYDDKNCLELLSNTKAKCLTYSIKNKIANFYAENINFDENGFPSFDVLKNGTYFDTIALSVPGIHNVSNSLACIALCDEYGIEKNYIKIALKKFTGADRRFEFKGKLNGANIFDDYAHHPTEIEATVNAMKNKKYNKSWVVFQPHTYSRTANHLEDFAKVLMNFDNIIIIDIYAAREKNIYNISSKDLVDKICSLGKKAIYLPDFESTVSYLKENISENDLLITLGAGTVTQIGPMLLK